MKAIKILVYFLIALTVSVSSGYLYSSTQVKKEKPTGKLASFTITENFENATKSSYKSADVNLKTGSWTFDNALIGDLPNDKKTATKSARIRTGSIATNFDINGVKLILINHAVFGNDDNVSWKLLVSTDRGKSYKQIGKEVQSSPRIKLDSIVVPFKGKIRIKILSESLSRINICSITFKGLGDPEIEADRVVPPVSGPSVSSTLPGRLAIKGKDAPPATGENSNLYLGNPSNASFADPDNYLIDQYYYIQSYNRTKGIPNWVSWHLDKNNITESSGRVNNFAAYSGLPSGWYQVQSNSYAESGFDRGHNCPSGDRTSSRNANASTFLMTNMIPQAPQNNQKPWADFEVYIREQVKKGNEAYIIMGIYGEGGSGSKGNITLSIDGGKVSVPSNIWKVVVILPEGLNDLQRIQTGQAKIIAINTPNTNVIATDWRKYIVKVRDLEKATGYNLLSALPGKAQEELELQTAVGF